MLATLPKRHKSTPRLIDIAAVAGVGIATVNRVLNDSGKASVATRERVIRAARQLGAPRLMPEVQRGLTRFDFVIAQGQTAFSQRLERALTHHAQLLDRRITVYRQVFDPADDRQIAAFIKRPPHVRNGLILAAHDTVEVREAVLHLIKHGVPVVTLLGGLRDINGLHYAGIDNLQAGRCAGSFLGRMCAQPGRVLVLCKDLEDRAHRDRSKGFLSVLQQHFPHLDCLPVLPIHDDADQAFAAVDHALRATNVAPLAGIYNCGAGAQGLAQALRQHTQRTAWIGHELNEEHRSHLGSGAMDLVIDEDPDGQILASLQYLLHATQWLDQLPATPPTDFRLHCAQNISLPPCLPAGG